MIFLNIPFLQLPYAVPNKVENFWKINKRAAQLLGTIEYAPWAVVRQAYSYWPKSQMASELHDPLNTSPW